MIFLVAKYLYLTTIVYHSHVYHAYHVYTLTTYNSVVKDLVNVTPCLYFTIRHVATLQKQLLSHTVSLETVSTHLVTAVSLSINQAQSNLLPIAGRRINYNWQACVH